MSHIMHNYCQNSDFVALWREKSALHAHQNKRPLYIFVAGNVTSQPVLLVMDVYVGYVFPLIHSCFQSKVPVCGEKSFLSKLVISFAGWCGMSPQTDVFSSYDYYLRLLFGASPFYTSVTIFISSLTPSHSGTDVPHVFNVHSSCQHSIFIA